MSNVSFAVTLSGVDFPVGTGPVAKLTLIVSGPENSSQDLAPDATSASVAVATAGDYTASIQAFDASGAAIGGASSAAFSIVSVPTTVTLQIPSALSATVSA